MDAVEMEGTSGRVIEQLEQAVKAAFPLVVTMIGRPPRDHDGAWWLDLIAGSKRMSVEWSPKRGFGIHAVEDAGYGEGPDVVFDGYDAAWEGLRKLIDAARDEPERLLEYTRMLTLLRAAGSPAELETNLVVYLSDAMYPCADIVKADQRVRLEKGW